MVMCRCRSEVDVPIFTGYMVAILRMSFTIAATLVIVRIQFTILIYGKIIVNGSRMVLGEPYAKACQKR